MSDELPLVSVVVPTYNYAHYLSEAIDSVLAQDYPNIELIVLDDGSTDNTREVLESYGDRFYWETHENMGEANTLNKGWAMSKGDILGKLSADDVLLPGAVSACVTALRADPEAVMAYPLYEMISADSTTIYEVNRLDFGYRGMVAKLKNPVGPGAFFRRWVYEAAGPWSDWGLGGDLEFWLKLGLCGRLARVPQVLALYRAHEDSQSFSWHDEAKSEEYMYMMRSFYERQRLPAEILALKRQAMSSAYFYSARSHLMNGRPVKGLARMAKALYLHPKNLSEHVASTLTHGMLNYAKYRRQARQEAAPQKVVGS